MTTAQPVDPQFLGKLVPVNSLNPENFRQLLHSTVVEERPAGEVLFHQGDTDHFAIYLMTGEVVLGARNTSMTRSVVGGSDTALYALSNLRPRQYTAIARTPIQFIRLNNILLDKMITWDQVSGLEVTELDSDPSDSVWMMKLLQTPIFLKLPAAHIQTLLERFEEVPMKTGQIIVKQGAPGDYFYIVKAGRCRVVQKADATAASAVVADLEAGDGFGEDALVSDAPRNATVAALTPGALMRLVKSDFDPLLKEPLLQRVTQSEAVYLVADGAQLLDVRLENEYSKAHLHDSINIPLIRLRAAAAQLDKRRKVVAYCDTGRRSAAAAYLLAERGFDSYMMSDGIVALLQASVERGLH